ncbi:hypothetical protein [Parvularcula lutaonensis]|uniref:Uncharacterized protein n=1 Tax=Parvularcula lutaonensis TaxID=491923 RepID=A0ABV7M8L4_9PROT|nr:hypothetical protein [Parvularcula lutaonensis]
MTDQDDLLFLSHLRAHGCDCALRRERSKEALAAEPGRAAGRVAGWALGRTLDHLQRFGRRGWSVSDSIVPTAQEHRLIQVIRALAAYDYEGAKQAALWLVPEREVAALLDRAAPLTVFYAPRGEGRRAAQA